MYYNQQLNVTTLDIDLPLSATIILQIHSNKIKTNPIHTIINIYRRPRKDKEFTINLQRVISTITSKSPKTSITIQGDINYDLKRIKATHPLIKLMQLNNLYTTITTPTRTDPHHGTETIIDVIITNLTQTRVTSGTISPPMSDHLAIYATFHNDIKRQKRPNTPTLTMKRYEANKETILESMKREITDNLNPTSTTNDQLNNIQQAIRRVIEQYEKRPRAQRKPWCNPTIKRKIKKQHKLHEQRLKYPTEANILKHTTYRNELNKEIIQRKKQHICQALEQTIQNPKQQAKILRSLIPTNKTLRQSPTSIQYENKIHTDPTDIANALNDFFITIGQKTNSTIIPNLNYQQPPPNILPPFELKHTNEEIVTERLKKLNPNKASDIYKVKPIIIKDLATFLAPTITRLFNNAITEHEYPSSLKQTKVIELYKAKDKTLPQNYRPISLIPIIAKIFDQIVNDQMMEHTLKHDILSKTQYAFRPNSSTTLALQTIINKLQNCKTRKQATTAIYIDLSKAYDTVSHQKLIDKLEHNFSFTPNTISYIKSYFKDRPQSTHTQNAISRTQTITNGIPQGSTLSTTFFLLYINDIIKTVPRSDVYTYADDTTLIISTESIQTLQETAQSELSNLINYFNSNNLTANPTKTNYSIFYPTTKGKDQNRLELKIESTILEQNTSAKLLGIYIQEDLKFDETIRDINRKLQIIIQSFKYANKITTTNTMKQLYYTHVYPHLIGSISISGTEDLQCTYMQPLIVTHKRIMRLIVNRPPRTHTEPIMNELGIMNLKNLYVYRVCTEIHPYIHPRPDTNRPFNNHTYTTISLIHDHRTRRSAKNSIFNEQPNKETPHNGGEYLTKTYTQVWNKIPQNIRDIKEKNRFKRELKALLLKEQSEMA